MGIVKVVEDVVEVPVDAVDMLVGPLEVPMDVVELVVDFGGGGLPNYQRCGPGEGYGIQSLVAMQWLDMWSCQCSIAFWILDHLWDGDVCIMHTWSSVGWLGRGFVPIYLAWCIFGIHGSLPAVGLMLLCV